MGINTAKEAKKIMDALNYTKALEIAGRSTELSEDYKKAAERSEKLLESVEALERLGEAIEAWEYETAEKLRVITSLWCAVEKLKNAVYGEVVDIQNEN